MIICKENEISKWSVNFWRSCLHSHCTKVLLLRKTWIYLFFPQLEVKHKVWQAEVTKQVSYQSEKKKRMNKKYIRKHLIYIFYKSWKKQVQVYAREIYQQNYIYKYSLINAIPIKNGMYVKKYICKYKILKIDI